MQNKTVCAKQWIRQVYVEIHPQWNVYLQSHQFQIQGVSILQDLSNEPKQNRNHRTFKHPTRSELTAEDEELDAETSQILIPAPSP